MFGSSVTQEMGGEEDAPPPGPTAGLVSVDTDTADPSPDDAGNTGSVERVQTETDFKFNFVIEQ